MSDMTADAAVPGYTPVARLLHWTVAVLVLLMIPLGIVIANEWGGPAQQFLYNLHKSIGATLIPLVVIRLLYRMTHPAAAVARATFRRSNSLRLMRHTGLSTC